MPHKNLEVWKQSIDFVTEIYKLTNLFPKEELYGLVQQMRRSAVSVPSNIAEGCGRKGNAETIQFLYIAAGSTSEIETQIIIANKIGFLSIDETEKIISQLDQIKRLLFGLIKSYKNKQL